MNNQIIECVPNFSEGRDENIINSITSVIETIEGVKLFQDWFTQWKSQDRNNWMNEFTNLFFVTQILFF